MSRRNRKNRNDSIKPPKPDEEEVLRDALYNQGFDVEKMMGSSGTFEMPNQIPNSYEADTSQGGEQHGSGSGMMGGGQEDDEVMKQMKRLGVGPAATMTLEERGITQEDLASVGNIQGLGGMPMGASDMVGSRGQQEESDMTAMMKGLEDLSEKDKEAALLAMGGPELLQQYYQQEAESRGGRGEMFGSSGQTGGGGQGRVPGAGGMLSSGRSNRGRGRMMGGRGRGRGNPGFPGMGGGGIPNMNGGGIPNMNGGGIPNMNGGGMPNMSGGGFPSMGGGGFPGTPGSGGTGELDQENMMQMLQQFQMIEALPKNEKEAALLSMGGQEFLDMYNEKIAPLMQMTGGGGAGGLAGLLGGQGGGGAGGLAGLLGGQGGGGAGGLAGLLGGQGGGGAGGLAGLMGGQGGGGAGGLAGLLGGQGGGGAGGLAGLLGGQGGGGAGGLAGLLGGQGGGGAGGLAGLLGGQGGGGAGGLAGLLGGQGGGGAGGLAGLLGEQGGGGVPGLGGMGAGSGGLFGTGGRGGGDRNRKRQFDTKTFEGLKDLSDEDKQAAFNAMGLSEEDKIAALESLKHPDQTGQPGMQSETSEPRQKKRYWPPDHPYEPKGPGMYQFHRRQPLQLPIHSAGAESRRSLTGLMPLRRRKRRFGEKDLVRTHGSTIDVEGYFRHLVQTWTKSAEECKDPMCEGPSTIILLDVSESMRGEPIREAVEGIQLYLDGLEYNKTEYGLEENIGLLVFHGDTFEVTHLTNDYSKIQNAMDNLKEVIGASPLIMPLAVVWGMATRAKPVEVKGHRILAKVVIFTDACITPPGYDPTQEEFVRQRVQDSVDANFFEVTGDMIHDQKIRLWSVPSGEKARDMREWFCNRIAHDGFGEKIFPNECRFLSRNYICEKIVAECSAQLPPLNRDNPDDEYDEERVKDIAKSMFEDVDEDDIDFVMNRLKEKLQRPPLSKRQRREKRLQDERDRAEAIERGENPPPLPDDPDKKKRTKKGRKSLEELLGIDSSDDEEDNEESDLLFRLPGLLGDEEDAENDPLTKHKIQELLEYYGGGPPKTDNLPIMPNIGTRVKIGPDWMWQKNEIPDGTHGTIIGVDYEDVGWVRVRWDPPKGSSEPGKEEDYRYGLDYDFDVEPVDGGMDAVKWQAGKERKIVEPIWLQELNREKEELAELRRKIEEEKIKEKKRAECRETRLEREAQENQEQMRADEKARQIEDGGGAGEKTRQIEGKTETITTQTAEESSWSDLSSETSERSSGGQVCYVWQYRDNDGTWRTFETDIQLKLEQTYVKRSGKGTVVIQFKGHNERVVFEKMEQRRIDKHSKRPVRRIEADADRLKELQDMFSS